jgi:tripartite-type tricarboxylate transporter receptor subunit TctC
VQLVLNQSLLVAHPSVPVSNVKELIALAKAKPGQVTYASYGNGSSAHLIGELFKMMAGIDLLHVPYKGAAPAQTDLLGGQVDLLFDNPATLATQVRAGRIRAIAQTRRNALLTDVPLFSEAGLRGFEDQLWYGLVAPAGTPPAVRDRLAAALREALGTRTMQASLLAQGVTPADPAPQVFAATLRRDVPLWADAVKMSNVKLD